MSIIIRQERPADYEEIYALVKEAFATADFSDGTEADYLNEVRFSDCRTHGLCLSVSMR